MYGFTLGRFLSADLYVQSPYNSQSFNRYSYTFNNPLSFIDPTGYRSLGPGSQNHVEAVRQAASENIVVTGRGISQRHNDAMMASNRQMLFMQQSMQQFVRNMIGQGKSAFTYTMEDGQKYVVHIDAEAFEAGTSGGGAANDSSVGTGNSHSDDSESRNGRGLDMGEAQERGCSGQMCRGRDPRITTSTWVDPETGEHFYQIRGAICSQGQGCDGAYADSVYEYVNQNDLPFTSNDLGSGQRNLLPYAPRPLGNQPIRHIENAALRTSVNVALEGHNFYPGTVTHRVQFQSGTLYYDVVGVGTGSMPSFNNNVGVGLFTSGVRSVVDSFGR